MIESDLEPWRVFQHIRQAPMPLFLDSSLAQQGRGRYSFITADPFAILRLDQGRLEWRIGRTQIDRTGRDPFQELSEALGRLRLETVPGLPPFQGGAAGLFGYGLCHWIEKLPRPAWDEFRTPDLAVGLYDWVYAFDQELERGWIIATGLPGSHPADQKDRARDRIRWVHDRLRREPPALEGPFPPSERVDPARLSPQFPVQEEAGLTSSFSRDQYLEAVRRAIDYVHAGDCFQVNIAQRLLCPAVEHPFRIYERLRRVNPAPFSAYLDLGDFIVASASPERFLRVDAEGRIETRPIKGTRPRGRNPEEDQRLAAELRQSAKDRAENVMIVDLLRNDLGRVCRYGSVQVAGVCEVETYQTVHHLVSTVLGRLREERSPADLLRAAFPGGSVTGAPKVRAMEIIAEIEPTARGPYCGSLGYIGFNGTMDTSILIRTFVAGKGWVQFAVGGGIVADSEPEREYEETMHKAAGLLRSLHPDEPGRTS